MPIEENDMINMRAKMSGFIFPNVPISDFERAAFERAVNYQIEHERQRRAAVSAMPNGRMKWHAGLPKSWRALSDSWPETA